jgi:glycosyltransferase involved in cell wall biosynthesis
LNPKISIITISYNAAETISDTIKSVINQDYENIEYIIVDGGSKDKTADIVRSFGFEIDTFVSEKDKGIYDAMNKGLAMATGDVIGILNADDVYADTKVISDVVKKMQEENTDSLYADLVYVKRENVNQITRYWKAGKYTSGKFLKGWMPPHPTFFVKRELYHKYGNFTLDLTTSSDYEIMLRLLHKYKISVSYLPRVITKMRLGGVSNLSLKNRIRNNKEDRKAWKMNGLKPGAFTFIRKPLSKVGQFFRRG